MNKIVKLTFLIANMSMKFKINQSKYRKLELCSLLNFLFLFMGTIAYSQKTPTKGVVLNEFTKEPIPFASIYFKNAGYGVQTDSVGKFFIKKNSLQNDSIIIRYVGYETYTLSVSKIHDTAMNVFYLKEAKTNDGVLVKTKFNKGLKIGRAHV